MKAIYETDIQNDFSLRNGALFIKGNDIPKPQPYGAEKRLPNIYDLHEYAQRNGWIVLGSVDRHFYEDAELIRNKGGAFDDHCMNGTWGQLRLPGLEPQKDIYVRRKDGPMLGIKKYTQEELKKYLKRANQGKANLIFEKQSYDVGKNPNFELSMVLLLEELERKGDKEGLKMFFNGFATDYCLPAAVLKTLKIKDKYQKNIEIYVVKDAIEAVNINTQGEVDRDLGKKALENMVKKGAKLITTKEVLEGRVK